VLSDAQMLVLLLWPGTPPEQAQEFLDGLANLQSLPVPPPTLTPAGDWNVRSGPSLETAVVGAAPSGALQERHGQIGDWVLVRDMAHSGGGWVHMRAFE
jgi:hypothetical protein